MRLFCAFLTTILLLNINALGQITLNQNDMPVRGETYRFSTAANPGIVNFQLKGPNQTWDYSNLRAEDEQYVDTYYSMNNVPSIYQILRFQKGANLSKKEQQLAGGSLPVGGPLDNIYSFFESNARSYSRVAYGVTLSSNDIPVQFDTNDVVYNFPLQYGQKDSNTSFFSFPPSGIPLPLPGDIYFERQQKRVNTVDGWGTLKTPLGEFQTLRVKTELYYDDSLYAQGQGQDIPINKEIRYKWLAKGMGPPLLTVQVQEVAGVQQVTNITYQDDCNPTISSIKATACDLYTSPSGEYTWKESGSYRDTVNNATPTGCDSVYDINLTIKAVDSTIMSSEGALEAKSQNASYQWLNCNNDYTPIGKTSKTYKPSSGGSYAVEITKNGCTDTSSCQSLSSTGSTYQIKEEISIIANSLNDHIKINGYPNSHEMNYRLQTTTGKIVKSGDLNRSGIHKVEVSSLSSGIYLMVIQGEQTVKTKKVVVE